MPTKSFLINLIDNNLFKNKLFILVKLLII